MLPSVTLSRAASLKEPTRRTPLSSSTATSAGRAGLSTLSHTGPAVGRGPCAKPSVVSWDGAGAFGGNHGCAQRRFGRTTVAKLLALGRFDTTDQNFAATAFRAFDRVFGIGSARRKPAPANRTAEVNHAVAHCTSNTATYRSPLPALPTAVETRATSRCLTPFSALIKTLLLPSDRPCST